jgi:hypothetical protein
MIGMLQGDAVPQEAADAHGRLVRAVRDLWKKHNTISSTQDKPHSDRPPILVRHAKKLVYWAARASLKILYKDLIEAATVVHPDGTTSKPPSHSILYWVLKLNSAILLNTLAKRDRNLP